ncbi:MAG: DUF2141 domain-containing protein [Emcibacteraceae bacterium]|nr:DUF2141 domain-containing protein [Emcibacteraceae bacterium]
MPTPSKSRLIAGIVLTAGIFTSGAYLASALGSDQSKMQETTQAVIETIKQDAIDNGSLSITIDGVRNDTGKLIVMVFNSEDAYNNYDYTKAVGFKELPASMGNIKINFPDLNDGPYAVTFFHDENGDYDFNMNGEMPLEGYGTSGASGPYDEVSYENALVPADEVNIKIHYLQ